MTPEELAATLAEHAEHVGTLTSWCLKCCSRWPCLPYRLASELAEAQRVLAYIGENYGRLLAVHEAVVMDTPEDRELHDRAIATFKAAIDVLRSEARP